LPALVHAHGLVMTLWIVLFLTQVSLVAARRVDLHRRLGMAGALLAAIVVIVGIATARQARRRPGRRRCVLAIPIGVVPPRHFRDAALLMRRRATGTSA
jgi:hypothetical protein